MKGPKKKKHCKLLIPLATESISAGFPSPAENYLEKGIDLNEHLIRNPSSTFFLKVDGMSMTNAGINNNDLIIVDRSLDPKPGHIVVAILDGEFTLKRLIRKNNLDYLKAENSQYPLLSLSNFEYVQIWGVAIYSIHKLERINK